MNSAATPVAIHPSAPGPAAVTPRRLHFGPLELASRYLLSPLAGYTNYPFRLAVRALGGVGLATTDLVNARALLLASRKTMELIRTGPDDRPLAIQPQKHGSVARKFGFGIAISQYRIRLQ